MSIADIKLENWFEPYNQDEIDQCKNEDDRKILQSEMRVWNQIKPMAEKVILKLTGGPLHADLVRSALDEFNKSLEKIEEASDSVFSEVVADFMAHIIEKSETGLDLFSTMQEIRLGLVGKRINPESVLYKYVSREDVMCFTSWITENLRGRNSVEIPGFIKINARRRMDKGIKETSGPSVSFSYWIMGDLTDIKPIQIDFVHLDDPENLIVPTELQVKSFESLALGLIAYFQNDSTPVQVDRFGIFVLQDLPGYQGLNPRTGQIVEVPGKRLLAIKFDQSFAQTVL